MKLYVELLRNFKLQILIQGKVKGFSETINCRKMNILKSEIRNNIQKYFKEIITKIKFLE
jgi:hypothetical protein